MPKHNGERHWKAKLTEDDVRLICELLRERDEGAKHLTIRSIAKQFAVSHHPIQQIASGNCWKHITQTGDR
jgi:hypothetical protein